MLRNRSGEEEGKCRTHDDLTNILFALVGFLLLPVLHGPPLVPDFTSVSVAEKQKTKGYNRLGGYGK